MNLIKLILTNVILLALMFINQPVLATEDVNKNKVVGKVTDQAERNLPLIGATVQVVGTNMATVTNHEGEFILNLTDGTYEIRVSFLGYDAQTISLNVPEQTSIQLSLRPSMFQTNEVIVTASPTGSAVNYQSARAYTETEISRRAALSLGEMLDGEPGLSSRSFGGGPSRPVIRGFDGERLIVLENGERMGDIQSTAPDHAITLDPLGMSRVEVVRGPASLLYGSSALGGVINLFTNDFASDWREGLSGGVTFHGASNNNLLSGSTGLVYGTENHSIAGRFIYRTAGDASSPAGTIPNTGLDSYSGSLGWGVKTGNFNGGISARYYQNHYGVPEFAAATDPDNPDRFIEEEPDMEVRIHRWNVQARGNQKLNGFFENLEFRASGSFSLQEEGEPDPLPEELELEIQTWTLSSTVMLLHRPFAFFDKGVIGTNLHIRYQEVDGIEAYHPGEDIKNVALFTFQEIPFTDRLSMQLGGRIEHEWIATVENRFFPVEERFEDTELNFAGSIGLNFRPFSGLEIGTQFARAHRNPTILERYADGWHAGATRVELGDPTLQSEVGHGVDLFSRFTYNRLQLEVSGFYNRIDNFIALRTLEADCGCIEYRVVADREFPACVQFYGADAEMLGFEASAVYFFTDWLRLDVSGDYVMGTQIEEDGNQPLPFIPPFRVNAGLNFNYQGIMAGINARYVSAQTRVPEFELPTDGYFVMRLEGGYRFHAGGVHNINVRVDNLLNTEYFDHLSVVRRYKDPILGPDNPSRFNMPGVNVNLIYRYTF